MCVLVDTGASVAILPKQFYQMCNSPTSLNVSNDVTCKFVSAGDKPLIMLGKTELSITIGDCQVPFAVQV